MEGRVPSFIGSDLVEVDVTRSVCESVLGEKVDSPEWQQETILQLLFIVLT